ncbi:peptidase P60 [Neorhizobium lilium]|uniref:Peptidase P60 n=1 Tax=Neorhizobium lilium TaxID=2503024 RepID=A0A3S4UKU1_9HYPH|nr:NlpC/P60 family protein [Neorhizobium lilium]RWX76005.1 peptidase P60 [Neorhizobium lilium]
MSASGVTIVRLAEDWIGTPYRHQGALKHVGCDCIGLIRGIWQELYGEDPGPVPAYAPDWAERSGEDRLMNAALRLFGPALPIADAMPGDLLLFRWRADCAAKHAGILCGPQHFIHAYEQTAVTRSALVPAWRKRVAGVFRFPPASHD